MPHCAECGKYFRREPSEHWKMLCLDCWKAPKKAEVEELRGENEEFRKTNEHLQLRLRQLKNRPSITYHHQQHQSDFLSVYPLLVQLSHPDKHNVSPEADEVMVWCNGYATTSETVKPARRTPAPGKTHTPAKDS